MTTFDRKCSKEPTLNGYFSEREGRSDSWFGPFERSPQGLSHIQAVFIIFRQFKIVRS